jgi:hypothetical protein
LKPDSECERAKHRRQTLSVLTVSQFGDDWKSFRTASFEMSNVAAFRKLIRFNESFYCVSQWSYYEVDIG